MIKQELSDETYKQLFEQLKTQLKSELKTELKAEITESYFADFGRGAAKKILYLFGAVLLVSIGASGSAEKLAEHLFK